MNATFQSPRRSLPSIPAFKKSSPEEQRACFQAAARYLSRTDLSQAMRAKREQLLRDYAHVAGFSEAEVQELRNGL